MAAERAPPTPTSSRACSTSTTRSSQRGEGVRLYTDDGYEVLDACSGGAMVACLGHGATEIVEAAHEQAQRISYFYNHHFTNEPQERLAERLLEVAAPEMARVRFVSGGSEANETALRLVRQYHVDRGEPQRWRVISQAQAYHGSLMGALALTGRQQPAGALRRLPRRPPAHRAVDLALRSQRRGALCRSSTARSRRPARRRSRRSSASRSAPRRCRGTRRRTRFWEGLARAPRASTASWSASTRS